MKYRIEPRTVKIVKNLTFAMLAIGFMGVASAQASGGISAGLKTAETVASNVRLSIYLIFGTLAGGWVVWDVFQVLMNKKEWSDLVGTFVKALAVFAVPTLLAWASSFLGGGTWGSTSTF